MSTHGVASASVWATALALAALQRRYAGQQGEWVLIGGKVARAHTQLTTGRGVARSGGC